MLEEAFRLGHHYAGQLILGNLFFRFSASCSLGEFVGPLLGGFMTHYFGYVKGCTYTGVLLLIIAAFYALVFCDKSAKKKALLKVEEVIDLSSSIKYKNANAAA